MLFIPSNYKIKHFASQALMSKIRCIPKIATARLVAQADKRSGQNTNRHFPNILNEKQWAQT